MATNLIEDIVFELRSGWNGESMSAGGDIRHGRTKKEVKIGKYFFDGSSEQSQIVYEFDGCVFHGHPECTEQEDKTSLAIQQ